MSFAQTGLELGNFLSYLARRQEVIASNIANADTPGYKSRDIQAPSGFSNAFEEASASLNTIETPGLASGNDGNNVSVDREARLLSQNTIQFNLATQMLRGEIRDIKSAIEEGRSS